MRPLRDLSTSRCSNWVVVFHLLLLGRRRPISETRTARCSARERFAARPIQNGVRSLAERGGGLPQPPRAHRAARPTGHRTDGARIPRVVPEIWCVFSPTTALRSATSPRVRAGELCGGRPLLAPVTIR